MEELFNINTILLHTLNAAVLFAALYLLLYKPVRKFTAGRAEKIEMQLREGEAAMSGKQALLDEGEAAVRQARVQGEQLLAQAAGKANENAIAIIDEANKKAEEIIEGARREAKNIMTDAKKSMAEEAAKLAVEMTRQLIEREISQTDQYRLVDDFLDKVG